MFTVSFSPYAKHNMDSSVIHGARVMLPPFSGCSRQTFTLRQRGSLV